MKSNELKEIINNIGTLDVDDLNELSKTINTIIKEKSKSVDIELRYNRYEGTGKCWIAEVDKDTKKILSFVKEESVIRYDNYKGSKIFRLKDGYYLSVQAGSKINDKRKYIKIENGKIFDF